MKKPEEDRHYGTGWFGRPQQHGSHYARWTKVHVVVVTDGLGEIGRVLCGYKPHRTMEYQFCTRGIRFDYIESPRCKERAKLILEKYHKKELEALNAR